MLHSGCLKTLKILETPDISQKKQKKMAKMNFGGVEEEVITREEFSLEKAREVLKDETIAVLGYGVQGPGQACTCETTVLTSL